ncbi:helix-turn-helix domain-containing protein [Chitinibacter sp. FCG-7]|uniref:Helix-turn-helix domain-containing protein n=1 Tax=Chitinibacter mangrovi TaxID=3153927 RepID=A0AAU7FCN6_9NEIS
MSHFPQLPIVSGQCADVLDILQQHQRSNQPVISFYLTADCAIPEAAARIHDLRCKGFNIKTTVLPEVLYRGKTRRKVAQYSLGSPLWPSPEYVAKANKSKRE